MRLEPLEASDELIVVIDRVRVVAARRIDAEQRDLDRLAHPAPALISARVHDQPVEPRVPAFRIAQERKTAPGSDEGILDGVLCLVRVPENEAGEAEQPIARGSSEEFERLMVAALCCLDEIALHRSLRLPGRQPPRHYMTATRG